MTARPLAREYERRLKGLQSGPWMEASRSARELLRCPKRLRKLLLSKEGVIDLAAASKRMLHKRKHKRRAREISKIFRPHWEKAVDDQDEIEIRDAFDEALSLLQLQELSVETGYLPLEALRAEARKAIVELLWPKGGRRFVETYDYLAVRYLARRVGVELGLKEVTPPAIDDSADVQFATFLSQHHLWYDDEGLDWWLGLLDDYVPGDELGEYEDEAFHRYLTTGKFPKEAEDSEYITERFQQRTDGLYKFLQLLSGLFSTLPRKTWSRYGLMYVYWMAKFFGHELTEKGYVRDADRYDWSRAVMRSPLFVNTGFPRQQDMARLWSAFQVTSALIR